MRHLRVVNPGDDAPSPRRRHTPSPALSLTVDEARHLRAAVGNIARTYGSKSKLAAALGIDERALTRGARRRPSPGLAVALSRLTGVPLAARGAARRQARGRRGPRGARGCAMRGDAQYLVLDLETLTDVPAHARVFARLIGELRRAMPSPRPVRAARRFELEVPGHARGRGARHFVGPRTERARGPCAGRRRTGRRPA